MRSPYENLPRAAFWKTGVADQDPGAIVELYRKKFSISRTSLIAAAGSCFAQHITRHLRARHYNVMDVEPAPPGLDADAAQKFGYGLYSARYGNIYTARQLLQLAEEAFGTLKPGAIVWEKENRFYDALRPSVEPNGLSTADAVRDHRAYHLQKVRQILDNAEIFVFTLGLTEAWVHTDSGTVYPTAPGTIAGAYDPAHYHFRNFTFHEIYSDLLAFFDLVKSQNAGVKFLLTVSPVPLTATASGQHVLQATVYSKSVLRAVAGQLYHERDDVDYVPSYEIITSALSCGRYFEKNFRSIHSEGIEAVMNMFFSAHNQRIGYSNWSIKRPPPTTPASVDEDEVVCEEAMLEAFAE